MLPMNRLCKEVNITFYYLQKKKALQALYSTTEVGALNKLTKSNISLPRSCIESVMLEDACIQDYLILPKVFDESYAVSFTTIDKIAIADIVLVSSASSHGSRSNQVIINHSCTKQMPSYHNGSKDPGLALSHLGRSIPILLSNFFSLSLNSVDFPVHRKLLSLSQLTKTVLCKIYPIKGLAIIFQWSPVLWKE